MPRQIHEHQKVQVMQDHDSVNRYDFRGRALSATRLSKTRLAITSSGKMAA